MHEVVEGTGRARASGSDAPIAPPSAAPRLFKRLPSGLDLRDEVQLESLLATADGLLGRVGSLAELADIECLLARTNGEWPLGARVAVKLARSKALLARRRGPLHLSVIVPLYAEHERVLPPEEHARGEGFLQRKLRQLSWLLDERRGQSFDLLLVDDGCPHASGHIAQQMLRRRHPRAPARVSFLADAIEAELPVIAPMRSVEESRKGGSVLYGMWQVTRWQRPGHVVLYTDADLSTHLGQAGLLVDALDAPGVRIAAGSRRASGSVVVKSASRSARGRLFIYLCKKLLPELGHLDDTQCGFKALPAAVARGLAESPGERGLAFDIELLLRSELDARRSTAPVPIAWIDSETASTTTSLEPYLPMLRSMVSMYRHHVGSRHGREPFAQAVERLDQAGWQRAIELFGPLLEAVDPALDRDLVPVSASALLKAAG